MRAKQIVRTKEEHILYLGDWVFHVGPTFIETPFGTETKDADLHFYGQRLTEALEEKADVTPLANWEIYRLEPGGLENYLDSSQCLIISDVEAKCFHLFPSFFDRARRENRIMTFPDRLNIIKEWIHNGGGLMMLGGWLSFSGVQSRSGWGRSVLQQALPVECLPGEDLVESSAGFTVEIMEPEHPLIKGLNWNDFPPIFGYNEVKEKVEGNVLVRIKETGHPLIVAGEYGKGRVFIFTSDPAPHWGINFELWKDYDRFWQQAFEWVKKKN